MHTHLWWQGRGLGTPSPGSDAVSDLSCSSLPGAVPKRWPLRLPWPLLLPARLDGALLPDRYCCTPLHPTAPRCSPDPSVGTGSSTVARHQAWCSPEPRGEPVCELSAHTPTHPAPGSVPAGPAGKAGKLRAPCVSTGGARGRAQPWYPHLLFAAAPRWVSTSRGCALLRLQPAKGLVQSGRHTHGVSPRLYLQ